jgi:iron complex outermembrane receptor protein
MACTAPAPPRAAKLPRYRQPPGAARSAGTLFGKNTTAGALLLSSAKPSTDRMEGLFDASYGNYNTFTVRAAGNVPISDHAAFRIAGVVSHRDGFYTNPTNGEHLNGDSTQAIKAQLLFEPTPDLYHPPDR